MAERADVIAGYFKRSLEALSTATADTVLRATVLAIADAVTASLRAGGKLMIAGNGGSAADAQHIAAELLSRFAIERRALPAIALTTDTSVLTAVGNDYGFAQVFERQVRGLGRPGDVFLAISTSGRSPNVIAALKAARETGLVPVGFTGAKGADMATLCDHCLIVPSQETAVIQQIHLVAAHAICTLVERDLAGTA